jgi:hypothetical protein
VACREDTWDRREVPDDSWKRPANGFRFRHNSPAGHIERVVAALRHQGPRRVGMALAVAAALLVSIMR